MGLNVQYYTFFYLGSRSGWVVNANPWLLYPLGRDTVPMGQEAAWASGTV